MTPTATDSPGTPGWPLAQRWLFRFAFAYFLLSLAPFPLNYFTDFDTPYDALWAKHIVPWVGAHFLHLSQPIVNSFNGSGDTTYRYVLFLSQLAFALGIAVLWSILDRRRPAYLRAWDWLHLYLRLYLSAMLFAYGFAKVFPLQFPEPGLERMIEPFGDASPMGILWTFVGASPAAGRRLRGTSTGR